VKDDEGTEANVAESIQQAEVRPYFLSFAAILTFSVQADDVPKADGAKPAETVSRPILQLLHLLALSSRYISH
jgi:hypothetical protein